MLKELGSLTELHTGQQAGSFLREELRRLAEFLSAGTRIGAQPVLADGAVPVKGAAASLDNEQWDGFCERFVHRARPASQSR